MSFIHGRIPTSADIIPDARGNAGHTHVENEVIPANYNRYLETSPEKQRYFEIRVLVALAGTAAHDLMCPRREHDSGDLRDEKQATGFRQSLGGILSSACKVLRPVHAPSFLIR
jgi:hypothetical protein